MTYVAEARINSLPSQAVSPAENITPSALLFEIKSAENASLEASAASPQDIIAVPREVLARILEENQNLKSENQELKEELQSVFCNSAETLEATVTSMKRQAVMRGKEFATFMDKAKNAVGSGDTNLVLAYVRQGIARTDRALHDWVPATKALTDPTKPRLVAVSKTVLRATQIKEHLEEHNQKSISSRDARKLLAGVEGQEPSRRDTIRALRIVERMVPQFVLEIYNGMRRLVCRGSQNKTVEDCQCTEESHFYNQNNMITLYDQARCQLKQQGSREGLIGTVSRIIQPGHDNAL
jgi:hypothetical protein